MVPHQRIGDIHQLEVAPQCRRGCVRRGGRERPYKSAALFELSVQHTDMPARLPVG
jgi:hypothetical protein